MKFFSIGLFVLLVFDSLQGSTIPNKRSERALNATLQTHFNGSYLRRNPCNDSDIERSSYSATHEFNHHTKETDWSDYAKQCAVLISNFLRAISNLVSSKCDHEGTYHFNINTTVTQTGGSTCNATGKQWNYKTPTIHISSTDCNTNGPECACIQDGGNGMKNFQLRGKQYNCVLVSDGSSQAPSILNTADVNKGLSAGQSEKESSTAQCDLENKETTSQPNQKNSEEIIVNQPIENAQQSTENEFVETSSLPFASKPVIQSEVNSTPQSELVHDKAIPQVSYQSDASGANLPVTHATNDKIIAPLTTQPETSGLVTNAADTKVSPDINNDPLPNIQTEPVLTQTSPNLDNSLSSQSIFTTSPSNYDQGVTGQPLSPLENTNDFNKTLPNFEEKSYISTISHNLESPFNPAFPVSLPAEKLPSNLLNNYSPEAQFQQPIAQPPVTKTTTNYIEEVTTITFRPQTLVTSPTYFNSAQLSNSEPPSFDSQIVYPKQLPFSPYTTPAPVSRLNEQTILSQTQSNSDQTLPPAYSSYFESGVASVTNTPLPQQVLLNVLPNQEPVTEYEKTVGPSSQSQTEEPCEDESSKTPLQPNKERNIPSDVAVAMSDNYPSSVSPNYQEQDQIQTNFNIPTTYAPVLQKDSLVPFVTEESVPKDSDIYALGIQTNPNGITQDQFQSSTIVQSSESTTTYSPLPQTDLVEMNPEQNASKQQLTDQDQLSALVSYDASEPITYGPAPQTNYVRTFSPAPQLDSLVASYPEHRQPNEYSSTSAPVTQTDYSENCKEESSDQSSSLNQKPISSVSSSQTSSLGGNYPKQSLPAQYVPTYAPDKQPSDVIYLDQTEVQNLQRTLPSPQQNSFLLSDSKLNIPTQSFTITPNFQSDQGVADQQLDQTKSQNTYDSVPRQDFFVTTYPEQNRPDEYFSTTAPIPQSDNSENCEEESSDRSSSLNQIPTTSVPSSQLGTFASDFPQQSLSDQYVSNYASNQQQTNDLIYENQLPIQNGQTTFSPPQQNSFVPSYPEQNIPNQFFTNAPNTQSVSSVIQKLEQTTYGPAPEPDFSVTSNPDQTVSSQNPISDASQTQTDENCDEESQKQTSFQAPEGIASQTGFPVISDLEKNQPNQFSPTYEPEPQMNREVPDQEPISFQDSVPTTNVPVSQTNDFVTSSQTLSSDEYETTHAPNSQLNLGTLNESQLSPAAQPEAVVFESRPQENTFVTLSPQQIESSPVSEPKIKNNEESKGQTSQLTLPPTFSPVAQPDSYMFPYTNQFRQTDFVPINAPDTQFKSGMVSQDQIPVQTLSPGSVPVTFSSVLQPDSFVKDLSKQTQPSKYFPTYAPELNQPNSDVNYQGQLPEQFLPQSLVPTTYEPGPQTESFLRPYQEQNQPTQYPTTYEPDNQPQAGLSYDNQSSAVNTPSPFDFQEPGALESLPVDAKKQNSMISAGEPLPDGPVFNNAEGSTSLTSERPQFQSTFAPSSDFQFSNANQYSTTFPLRPQTVENAKYVEEVITTTYSPQTSVTLPTYSHSDQLSNFNAPLSDSQVLDSSLPQQSQSNLPTNTDSVSKPKSISSSEQIPSNVLISEPENQPEMNMADKGQLPVISEGIDPSLLQQEPPENTFHDPRLRNRYVSTVAPETQSLSQSSSQSTAFTTYGPTAQPNSFVTSYPEQYIASPKPPVYASGNQLNADVIYQNQFPVEDQFPVQTSSQAAVSSIHEPSKPDQDSFVPDFQDPRLRNQFSSTLAPENQLNNKVIYQDQSPDQIEPQSSVTQKDSIETSFPENSFLKAYPTTYAPEPKTQNDDSCNECQEQSSSSTSYAPESQSNSFVTIYPEQTQPDQYFPTFAPQSQPNGGVAYQNQLPEQSQLEDDTYSLAPQQDSFMTSFPEQSSLNSYPNIHSLESKGQSDDSCDECQKQTSTKSPATTTYAPESVPNLPVIINSVQNQPSQYPFTFSPQSQITSDVSNQGQSPSQIQQQISDTKQTSFPQQSFLNLDPTTYGPEVQSQKDDSCHECQEQTSSQSLASTAYTLAPQQDSFVGSFSKPLLLSSYPTTYAPESQTQSDDNCDEGQEQTSSQGPTPTIYTEVQPSTGVINKPSQSNSFTTISSKPNGYAFETQEESPNQVVPSITLAPVSQSLFEKAYSQDYPPNSYSPTLAPSNQFNNDDTVKDQSPDQTSSLEMTPTTYVPVQSATYSDDANQFLPILEPDEPDSKYNHDVTSQNQNNAQTLSQDDVSQSDSLLIHPEQSPTYAPEYKPNLSYQGQLPEQFLPQSWVPTTYEPGPQTESFLRPYQEQNQPTQYPTTYEPDNQPQAGLSYDNQSSAVNTPSPFDFQEPGALESLPVDAKKQNSMISAGEPLPDGPVLNNAEGSTSLTSERPQFQSTFAPSSDFQFSNANQYSTTFPPRPQTVENAKYIEEVITTTYSPQTSVTLPTYSHSDQLSNFNAPLSDSQVIDTVPPQQPFDSFPTPPTIDNVNQKPALISQPEPDSYFSQSSPSTFRPDFEAETLPITQLPYVQDDILSNQHVPQSEQTIESQNESSQTSDRNNYESRDLPTPELSPKSDDIHTNFEQPQFIEALEYGSDTTQTNINEAGGSPALNTPTDAPAVMTENPLTVTPVLQSQLNLPPSNQHPNSKVAKSPDTYYPVDSTHPVLNTVQTTNSESQPPQDDSNALPDFKSQQPEFTAAATPQAYGSGTLPTAKNDASDAQGFPNYNQGFSTFTPQAIREEFIKDVITTTVSPLGGYTTQSPYSQQPSMNYYSTVFPPQATKYDVIATQSASQPQYNEQIPVASLEPTTTPAKSNEKLLIQLPDNNFHQEPLSSADNVQTTTYGPYFESFAPKNDQKLFYGTTFVPGVQQITDSKSTGDALASNSESLPPQSNYSLSPFDVKQLPDSQSKLTGVPAQSPSFETSTWEPKLQNNDFISYENENLNTYAPASQNPTGPAFQGSEMNENQQPNSNAPQRQELTIVYQDQLSNFNSKPQSDSLVTAPTQNLPVTQVRPQQFPQSNLEPTNFNAYPSAQRPNSNEPKQLESTTVPFHQFFTDMYSTFPSNMNTNDNQMSPKPISDNHGSVMVGSSEPVQDFLSNIITTIAPQPASDFDEDEDKEADGEVNNGSLSPDSGIFSDSRSSPNAPVENSAILEPQPLFHETSVSQVDNAEFSSSSGTTFAPNMQTQNKFLDFTGATPQQQESLEFSDKLANFNVRPKSEPTGEPFGTANLLNQQFTISPNSFNSYSQEFTGSPQQENVVQYKEDMITNTPPSPGSSYDRSFVPEYLSRELPKEQTGQNLEYSEQNGLPADTFSGITDKPNAQDQYQKASSTYAPQQVKVFEFEEDIITTTAPSYGGLSTQFPLPLSSYPQKSLPNNYAAKSQQYQSSTDPILENTRPDFDGNTPFPLAPQMSYGPTSAPGNVEVFKYEKDIITTTAPFKVSSDSISQNPQPYGYSNQTSSPVSQFLGFGGTRPQQVEVVKFEEDIITTTTPYPARSSLYPQAPINPYTTTIVPSGQTADASVGPSIQQTFDSIGTTPFPNFAPTSKPQFKVVEFEEDIITTTAPVGYRPPIYPQAPMNSYATTTAPTVHSNDSPLNQQPLGFMEPTSFPSSSPASNPQLVKEVKFEEDIITTATPAGSRSFADFKAPINSYATTMAPVGQLGAFPPNQQIFDSFGTTPFPNFPPTSNPQQVNVVKFEEDIITTTAPAGYSSPAYPQAPMNSYTTNTAPTAQSNDSPLNQEPFGFMKTTPSPNFPTNPGSQVKVVEITEETITTTAPRAAGPASQLSPFTAYPQIPSSIVQPNLEMSDQLSNFNSRQPEPSVNVPSQTSNENIYQTPYTNSEPQQVKIFEYEEDIITTRGPPAVQSLPESSQQPQNVYETTLGPSIQSVPATQSDQLSSYNAQHPSPPFNQQITTPQPQSWGYDQTLSTYAPRPTSNLYQFEESIVTTTAPYGFPSRSNQNSGPLEAPPPQLLDSTPSHTFQPDLSSANVFSNSASSVATFQPTNDALSTFGPVPDSTFSGLDHRRLPSTEPGLPPFSITFAPASQQPSSAPDDSFYYQLQPVGNTPYPPGLNYRDPINVNPQEINPNAGVSAAQDYTSTQQPDSYALVPDQTTPSNLPGENNVFTCAQGLAEPSQAVLPCPFSPEMIGNMTAPSYYILVSKLSNDSGSPCFDKEERFQVEKVYLGDGTPLNCSLSQTRTFPASLYKPVQFSGAATVKLPTSCDNA